MKNVIGLLSLLIAFGAKAQSAHFSVLTLDSAAHDSAEFSGLAAWGDKILFVCQLKYPWQTKLYYMGNAQLCAEIKNAPRRLAGVKPKLDLVPLIIENKELLDKLDGYDGIEAATVVKETVYFAIETRKDSNYIVRGKISPSGIRLDTLNGALQALKLARCRDDGAMLTNSGFESLAWVEERGQLLTIFELNALRGSAPPFVYAINPDLNGRPQTMSFQKTHYRITDAFYESEVFHETGNSYKGGNLYALNFWYRKEGDLKYKDLPEKKWTTDFAQIMVARYQPKTATLDHWTTIGVLPAMINKDWEGLCRLRGDGVDGFLVASDDNRQTDSCQSVISFVSLSKVRVNR